MENKEVIGQWSESARYWEKYRAVILEMFAPVTEALLREAGIDRGEDTRTRALQVLDVATGPGEPALTIAERAGTGGSVTGTDVAAEMIDAARREAERRQLRNARFEAAFTDALPFADDTFDKEVSRFGVMFFPDPVACLREMLRVLKPGGKMALAVWGPAENNPFHNSIAKVVDRYMEKFVAKGGDPAATKPGATDMFRYAQTGDLAGVLKSAGAANVSERVLRFAIRASLRAEEFWTLRSEMSEKLRTRLAMLNAEQRAELDRDAVAAIEAYAEGNGVSFPAEVLIVSGEKAG
jgi:ubiquinone/menaquinone biosynthesis C-methylase UbiE